MISEYVSAISRALNHVVDRMVSLALPLAVCLGLLIAAGGLFLVFPREGTRLSHRELRRFAGNALAKALLGILLVAIWAALQTTLPMAQQSIQWRDSAEATVNPVPDAPPVSQFSPALATLTERTYTRTLTLPPSMVERLGTEGESLLAPYLGDSPVENILRLMDNFHFDGRNLMFTRQVTRMDEEPIPFSRSQVRVKFRRLAGRAYDAEFEGHYLFENTSAKSGTVRFQFSLPSGNTIRDLSVSIGGQGVSEPNSAGTYEWQKEMQPGEHQEAVVRYRVLGAQTWHYDLGSQRRRVQQFELDVVGSGWVRYMRGSLLPTSTSQEALHWKMSNVVTAQQIALAFPPDTLNQDAYLQALSALPAALIVFLLGMMLVRWQFRQTSHTLAVAAGLVIFAVGLGAIPVLANYLGAMLGVLLAPLIASLLIIRVLGRWSLRASIPAALLPAAFLSPTHSGLLVLLLAVLALLVLLPARYAKEEDEY